MAGATSSGEFGPGPPRLALMVDETPEGCVFRIRVSPGSRRDRVAGGYGDRVKVLVSAPPEDDRANRAVVRLLAEALKVPQDYVSLRAGHKSRDKSLLVRGVTPAEIRSRLSQASQAKTG
jgi:uncharacterized protein